MGGSGLNGNGAKLSDTSARVVFVEHRDRLARFGVEHLEAAPGAPGDGSLWRIQVKPAVCTVAVAREVGRCVREPRQRGNLGRWLDGEDG